MKRISKRYGGLVTTVAKKDLPAGAVPKVRNVKFRKGGKMIRHIKGAVGFMLVVVAMYMFIVLWMAL